MNTQPNNLAQNASLSASDNASDKENQLTLELLQAIDQNDDISQRHLAQQMGVALGLANSYLKRCAKKGLIKITTAPANRYLYYLTPSGFAEKARLTGEFLSTSLALFRQSGDVYAQVFQHCIEQEKRQVALVGISDLTEIAYMKSLQLELSVVAVLQPESDKQYFFDVPIKATVADISHCDAFVLTSMEQTNEMLALLEAAINSDDNDGPTQQVLRDKIVVPSLLLNMNYRNDSL